jgi:ribosomal protein L40E
MLAGGAQRRYINWTSRDTRADLAHRVRALMIRRGASAVVVHGAAPADAPVAPVPVYLRQRCVHAMCRAELPKDANYCRRCGTRQKAQVNRVV